MNWTVDWTIVGYIGLAVLGLLLVVGGLTHALVDRAREGTLWAFDLVLAGTGGVALLACAAVLGAELAERSDDAGAAAEAPVTTTSVAVAPTDTTLFPLATVGLPTTLPPPVDPALTVAAAPPVPVTTVPVATAPTTLPPIPLTIAAVPTTPPPTPPPTAPTTAAPVAPAGEPVSGDFPCDGRWIVFLGSTNGRVMSPDAFLASVRDLRDDSSLVLVDTDKCASMSPGLWGVVVPAMYVSPDEAVGECRRRGLNEAVACMAVLLTTDAADRSERAFP